MVKLKIDDGYYLFKLGDILKKRDISINKIMRETNTDFKVIKRLIDAEELTRIDIFVVARMCNYLNCTMNDLIEYVPNKK